MKKPLESILAFSILISAGSAISAQPQSDSPHRGLRLEDGFLAEDIKEPKFSADGEVLAVVRLRPVKELRGYVLPIEGLRGDIWIKTAPGQPLKAITDGRADQAGYWKLKWSPDSRQLAFLRAQGETVTPWVWDREKNAVRQLSTRSVDHYDGEPCRWADARRLICLVAKEGETIPPTGGFAAGEQYGEVMRKAWDKQARGEATASALDSRFYDSPRGELLVIDTMSGESRLLSEAFLSRFPVVPFGDSPSTWWLAPSGHSVALLDPEVPIRNAADGKRIFSDVVWRRSFTIKLRSVGGGELKLSQPLPKGILPSSLQWSPDGQHLAFYTYDRAYRARDDASLAPRLWLVSVPRRQTVALNVGELRFASLLHQPWWDDDQDMPQMAPLLWTAGKAPQLLVRAGQRSIPAGSREEWWAVSDRHPPRAVSRSMSVVPQQWAVRTDTALIGLMEGDVWQLQPQTARARNLTAAFEPAITYVYPSTDGRSPSHILFGHGPHGYGERVKAGDWGKPVERAVTYRLNLQTGAIERLKIPATDAGWADTELADSALSNGSVAYLQRNWNGTSLWRLDGPEPRLQQLLTVNQFFRKIARPQTRWFDYMSSEGVKRRGWVMLPHGYVPGRRYPTVVTVRMGSLGFRREGALIPHHPAVAHLGSLSAMGYLIFSPDFDDGYQYRTTEIDHAMIRAGNDIHAALDAVVAQGYADPDRFVIEGGSGTGKSALNLIAATHRFKAASAYVMGTLLEFTNLPLYTRYTDYAHVYVSREGRNYPGMGYSREEVRAGSLLSHIDLVQTPVLLAHGDLDPVPLDTSEEYFNALVFQGKRAQFVRYWGESHCLGCTNQANMADFLQRELAWFDEFADIARDVDGHILWDGDRAKSRDGAAPLTPDAYRKFDFFASGGDSNGGLAYPVPVRGISAVVGQRE